MAAEDEVVELCRDLIRFESVNDGTGRGPGERAAAEYVAGKLEEVGLATQVFESAPNRTSVVTRMEGEDNSRPARTEPTLGKAARLAVETSAGVRIPASASAGTSLGPSPGQRPASQKATNTGSESLRGRPPGSQVVAPRRRRVLR